MDQNERRLAELQAFNEQRRRHALGLPDDQTPLSPGVRFLQQRRRGTKQKMSTPSRSGRKATTPSRKRRAMAEAVSLSKVLSASEDDGRDETGLEAEFKNSDTHQMQSLTNEEREWSAIEFKLFFSLSDFDATSRSPLRNQRAVQYQIRRIRKQNDLISKFMRCHTPVNSNKQQQQEFHETSSIKLSSPAIATSLEAENEKLDDSPESLNRMESANAQPMPNEPGSDLQDSSDGITAVDTLAKVKNLNTELRGGLEAYLTSKLDNSPMRAALKQALEKSKPSSLKTPLVDIIGQMQQQNEALARIHLDLEASQSNADEHQPSAVDQRMASDLRNPTSTQPQSDTESLQSSLTNTPLSSTALNRKLQAISGQQALESSLPMLLSRSGQVVSADRDLSIEDAEQRLRILEEYNQRMVARVKGQAQARTGHSFSSSSSFVYDSPSEFSSASELVVNLSSSSASETFSKVAMQTPIKTKKRRPRSLRRKLLHPKLFANPEFETPSKVTYLPKSGSFNDESALTPAMHSLLLRKRAPEAPKFAWGEIDDPPIREEEGAYIASKRPPTPETVKSLFAARQDVPSEFRRVELPRVPANVLGLDGSRQSMSEAAAKKVHEDQLKVQRAVRRARKVYGTGVATVMSLVKEGAKKLKQAEALFAKEQKKAADKNKLLEFGDGVFQEPRGSQHDESSPADADIVSKVVSVGADGAETIMQTKQPAKAPEKKVKVLEVWEKVEADGKDALQDAELRTDQLRSRYRQNPFDATVVQSAVKQFLESKLSAFDYFISQQHTEKSDKLKEMLKEAKAGQLWEASKQILTQAAQGVAKHIKRISELLSKTAELRNRNIQGEIAGKQEANEAEKLQLLAEKNTRILRDRLRFADWGGRQRGRQGWDELPTSAQLVASETTNITKMWSKGCLDDLRNRYRWVSLKLHEIFSELATKLSEVTREHKHAVSIEEQQESAKEIAELRHQMHLLEGDRETLAQEFRANPVPFYHLPTHTLCCLLVPPLLPPPDDFQWWMDPSLASHQLPTPWVEGTKSLSQLWSQGLTNPLVTSIMDRIHEINFLMHKGRADRTHAGKGPKSGVAQGESLIHLAESMGNTLRAEARRSLKKGTLNKSRMPSYVLEFIESDETVEALWARGVIDLPMRSIQEQIATLSKDIMRATTTAQEAAIENRARALANEISADSSIYTVPLWRLPQNVVNFLALKQVPGQKGAVSLRELVEKGLVNPDVVGLASDLKELQNTVSKALDYEKKADGLSEESAAGMVAKWSMEQADKDFSKFKKGVQRAVAIGLKLPAHLRKLAQDERNISEIARSGDLFEAESASETDGAQRLKVAAKRKKLEKLFGKDMGHMTEEELDQAAIQAAREGLSSMDGSMAGSEAGSINSTSVLTLHMIDPNLIPAEFQNALPDIESDESDISFDETYDLGWMNAAPCPQISFHDVDEDSGAVLPLVHFDLPSIEQLDFRFSLPGPVREDEMPSDLDVEDGGPQQFDYAEGADMATTEVGQVAEQQKESTGSDSDEEEEEEFVIREKKKKSAAQLRKERLYGKERGGIPAEVRKQMRERVMKGRRTKIIDLSNLGIPYIPKMVTDEMQTEEMILDHNLIDEIPAPMGLLLNLRKFSISHNKLEEIPKSMWDLERMREFNVDHNLLEYIPPEIVAYTALTKLKFDGNLLHYVTPDIAKLTALRTLTLDKNYLSELPKEIGQIRFLSILGLGHNQFYQIPDCVFKVLRLRVLHLQHNMLGIVPEKLGALYRLTDLNLSSNPLMFLPNSLSKLSELKRLFMDRLELRIFPTQICRLSTMTDLSLVGNYIEEIPESACEFGALKRLRFGGNRLTSLPENVTNLVSLTDLGVQNNDITVLRPHFGRMTWLKTLRVAGNEISTPFPQIVERGTKNILGFCRRLERCLDTGIMNLEKLKLDNWYHPAGVPHSRVVQLRLGKNALSEFKGEEIQAMINLEVLDLHENQFEVLPGNIGNVTSLQELNFDDNQVSQLPVAWGKLCNLQILSFARNRVIDMPFEYGRLSSLKSLDCARNLLKSPPPDVLEQGVDVVVEFLKHLLDARDESSVIDLTSWNLVAVPKILAKFKRLDKFSVDDNRLFALPAFIGNFDGLTTFSAHNCFLRSLPVTATKLTTLTSLDLSKNYFVEIPEVVCSCMALQQLNLSFNMISELNKGFANLTQMKILNLRFNRIITVPIEFHVLTNLENLDLRDNLLRLPIKRIAERGTPTPLLKFLATLQKATVSKVLDFSHRPYIFTPAEILQITQLVSLKLNNYKMRSLTYTISALTNLTSFDLSENSLVTLPDSLSMCNNLETLLLQCNRLFMPPYCIPNLTALRTLLLQQNEMTALLEEFSSLTLLKHLNVSKNRVIRLPDNVNQMSSLEEVDASCNDMSDLPSSLSGLKYLRSFDFRNNFVSKLPLSFCKFRNLSLKQLCMEDNGLRFPPISVTRLGLDFTWEYMQRFFDAKQEHAHSLDLTCLGWSYVPRLVLDIIKEKSKATSHDTIFTYKSVNARLVPVKAKKKQSEGEQLRGPPQRAPPARKVTSSARSSSKSPTRALRTASPAKVSKGQETPNNMSETTKSVQMTTVCDWRQLLDSKHSWGSGMPVPFLTVPPPLLEDTGTDPADKGSQTGSRRPAAGPDRNRSPSKKQKPDSGSEVSFRTVMPPVRLDDVILVPSGGGMMISGAGLVARSFLPPRSAEVPKPSKKVELKRTSSFMRKKTEPVVEIMKEVPPFESFPPVLGTQSSIETLYLDHNQIQWLPSWIKQCTTLTTLSIRHNPITHLPYLIGWLTQLKSLDFQGCKITSPDPCIMQRGTSAILQYMRAVDTAMWTRKLDLGNQEFEYLPEEVCDLTMLTHLDLQANMLSRLPAKISQLSNLVFLDLQYNQLVELPNQFSALHLLRTLDLKHNHIERIQDCLGFCTSLRQLRFHENPLKSGGNPLAHLTKMMDLRLFDDKIEWLTNGIGNLKYLPRIRLSYNRLTILPDEICECVSLRELIASHNQLDNLPEDIGKLTNLYRLRVGTNKIREIPASIGKLTALTELVIDHNLLTELPPEIGLLSNLKALIVQHNDLTSPPPEIVRKGTKAMVSYLRLMYEGRGAPPEIVLRGMNAVEYFHHLLEESRQTGFLNLRCRSLENVPKQVPGLSGLTGLSLAVNYIHTLPDSLTALVNLKTLDCSYNSLPDIPECFRAMTTLTDVTMSYNFFSFIPTAILQWSNIRRLQLDNNEIKELPFEVYRWTSLQELRLSNNQIRWLPPDVRNWKCLRSLWIEQNLLSTLPPEISNWAQLQELRIGVNGLEEFPEEFGTLQELEVFVAHCNQLKQGPGLPLDKLEKLSTVILTDNKLTKVPPEWVVLTNLQVLHIGNNPVPLEPEQQFMEDPIDIAEFLMALFTAWAGEQRAAKLMRMLRARKKRMALIRKGPGATLVKAGAFGDNF